MGRAPILIVEDEADIAELIQFHVQREGFPTEIVGSGLDALKAVDRIRPGLIILDIMLPDLDGLEVCKRLKRSTATRSIPVIMVTARGEESDIIVGLELGAEDYVTKPFSPRVLVTRIKTVLRRREPDTSGLLIAAGGRITIDPAKHSVMVNGEELDLTLTQYRLLHFLARRPGFVRTRDQMISAVRGEGAILSGRVIDVHVAALRQKLGDLGQLIETVRGVGYRLADAKSADPV